jgi:NAD(P)-dependent dehydrogenase (short-subunit alcohol dehydrogenase family)
MSAQFSKKVVLITGAGSGIGAACALAFAREGARVAVADINEAHAATTVEQIHSLGGEAIAISVDVTQSTQVAAMVERVLHQWGKLDIAFNNAGIGGAAAKTGDMEESVFDNIVAVNLKGVFLCMKYVLQPMLSQGGGVIINMASALALTVLPNQCAYTASKHAVAGLTKAAAVEYAQSGIRINAVCPGMIDTPMLRGSARARAGIDLGAVQPMGRIGTVEEVASAVLWLASDGSSFVTGTLLPVDGGWVAS